jgi:dihydroneopterin aldolase
LPVIHYTTLTYNNERIAKAWPGLLIEMLANSLLPWAVSHLPVIHYTTLTYNNERIAKAWPGLLIR